MVMQRLPFIKGEIDHSNGIPAMDIKEVQTVAQACRRGLERLSTQSGSMFCGFPLAACGPAAEIVGRILKEEFGCDGVYVCGNGHPRLKPGQSHAWYETANYIIDITHDQFGGTGLCGWVFDRSEGWHAEFTELEVRPGFCTPRDWPWYPFDGYLASLQEL